MSSVIAFLADFSLPIFLVAFVLYIFYHPELRHRLWLIYAALALGLSRGVVGEAMKRLIARPRPFVADATLVPLVSETGYSMPSGHALIFFSLSTAVYMRDKRWGIALYVLSIIFSLARVYAHIHYYSDILVGALLGVVITHGLVTILKSWRSYDAG